MKELLKLQIFIQVRSEYFILLGQTKPFAAEILCTWKSWK